MACGPPCDHRRFRWHRIYGEGCRWSVNWLKEDERAFCMKPEQKDMKGSSWPSRRGYSTSISLSFSVSFTVRYGQQWRLPRSDHGVSVHVHVKSSPISVRANACIFPPQKLSPWHPHRYISPRQYHSRFQFPWDSATITMEAISVQNPNRFSRESPFPINFPCSTSFRIFDESNSYSLNFSTRFVAGPWWAQGKTERERIDVRETETEKWEK